jgi:cohesin loading factor subunit SCC2
LQLYEKCEDAGLRGRILQCLGFLFRAQPSLMTLDRSAVVMDEIFSSQDEERRGRLLKIIQEFLISEAAKHSAKQKDAIAVKGKPKPTDVNMDELVGNTDGFADSGYVHNYHARSCLLTHSQRQLGRRTALPEPHPRSSVISASAHSSCGY